VGMRLTLEIPAYHSVNGDVGRRQISLRLDHLPRRHDQIEVPDNGIVSVTTVRFRPQWTTEGDGLDDVYGIGYAYSEMEPVVYTSWVVRPEDAPKTRSRSAR
jgi:hypothetical protein